MLKVKNKLNKKLYVWSFGILYGKDNETAATRVKKKNGPVTI